LGAAAAERSGAFFMRDVPYLCLAVQHAKEKETSMGSRAYEVKNVETFGGMEWPGFSVNLYRNDKYVAVVSNDGDGGGCFFQWMDMEEPREEVEVTSHGAEKTIILCTPEEAIFVRHVRNHLEGNESIAPEDRFVCRLVNAYVENKKLRSLCRTKTVWRYKGVVKRWFLADAEFSPAMKKLMLCRHGDLIEFANERFPRDQINSSGLGAGADSG